ncbi:MAG TPA: hypothetical protein VK465_02325 [Fibrobacteria bacterium]|nr:hypothetical protein [Fibrobacteria bacterium]
MSEAHASASTALATPEARKLNRISGRLRMGDLADSPHARKISQALDAVILGRPHGDLPSLFIRKSHPSEQEYFLNSQLVNALKISGKKPEALPKLETELKAQWQQRNTSDAPVIIAHRGDGATFEKAAVPFPRDHFDYRYKHEDENSKPALLKALDGWRDGRLHGVETDVGFSMDHVAMMEHTRETDRLDRQEKFRNMTPEAGGKELDHLKASELSDRHLSLKDWLDTVEGYVRENKDSLPKNRPLRLEIEMKEPELWFRRDRALTKGTDEEVMRNWRQVEREVSQFLKKSEQPGLYQVAFFNGSVAGATAQRNLVRDNKTMLGSDLVYGVGGPKALNPEGSSVPEARVGGHEAGIIRNLKEGKYSGRILTFAAGLEATPAHPSIPGGDRVQQVKTLGKGLPNHKSLSVEQAIQSARLRNLLTVFESLPQEKRPLRVQVMTDFGMVGADYLLDHKATPIGPIEGRVKASDLDSIWSKYKIKDSKVKNEAVDRMNAANGDQAKMISFGQWFLKQIGDE